MGAFGGAVAGTMVSLTGPAWAATSVGTVVTKDEVLKVQDQWKNAILTISKEYLANPTGEQFKNAAKAAAGELYSYGEGDVLFKPTKAKETPFRVKGEGAFSYFIGYDAIKPAGFTEDKGFAINGGKGWKAVRFENSQISTYGDLALAQGEYFFTTSTTRLRRWSTALATRRRPRASSRSFSTTLRFHTLVDCLGPEMLCYQRLRRRYNAMLVDARRCAPAPSSSWNGGVMFSE